MTTSVSLLTCIYCLQAQTADHFDREHVVPQAFGTFEHNLVLTRTVCKKCNQYFGDTLDRILSKGSPPGVVRYITGMRPPEQLNDADPSRLKVFLKEEKGLIPSEVQFVNTEDARGVTRHSGLTYWSNILQEWRFVSVEKLENGPSDLLDEIDKGQLLMADYVGEAGLARLSAALLGRSLRLDVLETFHERV